MANLLQCNTTLNNKENVFSKPNDLRIKINQDIVEPELHNCKFTDKPTEYLEQYRICVASSEDLVKRKQTTNNIYVTLNLALLSILIAIAGLDNKNYGVFITLFGIDFTTKVSAWIVVGFFGTLLCVSWLMLLKNYANLNSAKMSLIIQMEKNLPVNLFDVEWKYVSMKNRKGKYVPFSRSEKLRAFLFLFFYLLVILGGIILIGRQFITKQ